MKIVRMYLAVLLFLFFHVLHAASDPVRWSYSPATGFAVTNVGKSSVVTYTFTNMLPFPAFIAVDVNRRDIFSTQDSCTGLLILPRSSCTVSITFTPQVADLYYLQVSYIYHYNRINLPAIPAIAAPIETFVVTPGGDNNESIFPNASQLVKYNYPQSFFVVANQGHTLTKIVEGTCPIGSWAGDVYTTGPITSSCSVFFRAFLDVFTVSATHDDHVAATPPAQDVFYGANAHINVVPDAGYIALIKNDTCGGSLAGSTYTTGKVTANCVVNFISSLESIVAKSGTPQTTVVTKAFGQPLVVQVTDSNNNPVPNQLVTFTVPSSGASAVLSAMTGTTDNNGIVSVTATANGTAGSYQITAAIAGISAPAVFSFTNNPGAPARIKAKGGTPQATTVTQPFGSPLVVLVTDSYDNPVPNQSVIFTLPSSGASATLSSLTATTDSSGYASVTATANTTAGFYVVSAKVSGFNVSTAAYFSLTNTAGTAAAIAVKSGSGQSTTVGTAFPDALIATVTDTFGNPVPFAIVNFTAPGSLASAKLSSDTVITDIKGHASVTATASDTPGEYAVVATVNGTSATTNFDLSNTAGAPANITVNSGTPQSATVGTQFTQPLEAKVTDAFGNPVPYAKVTFTAPAPNSGAGATLSSSTMVGTITTITATTDSNGLASVTATANTKAGSYGVSATVGGVGAAAYFTLTNTAGAPADIAVKSGFAQSTKVDTAFARALEVKVTDAYNNPVPNASVTFAAPGGINVASAMLLSSSTTGTTITVTTGNDGLVSVAAKANTVEGVYQVEAKVTATSIQTYFYLSNTASKATAITTISGSPQSATVGTPFANSLVAKVTDTFGNPVRHAIVIFTVPGTGASATLSSTTATTDINGLASVTAAANNIEGAYQAKAIMSGVSAEAHFALTNNPGTPTIITVVSGSGQSATVGTAFTHPLKAKVTDTFGNAVPGATVTFTAPSGGASATLSSMGTTVTATTDSSGHVSVTATANHTPGGYAVTATVNESGATTNFGLSNAVGTPAAITVSGGSNQMVVVGNPFPLDLEATVTDTFGNVVPNVTVTFTAPNGGASAALSPNGATTTTATTDAGGVASISAVANDKAGGYGISATVDGLSASPGFTLTNNAGAPADITVSGGFVQSTKVGTAFAHPLKARVTDSFGNAVSGVTVSFTAPSGSNVATATLTPTAPTTDSDGYASVAATANTVEGIYRVEAKVTGVNTAAYFYLANIAETPNTITIESGSGQSATVNTAFGQPLVVKVTDASSNPVPLATVSFTIPSSGASATLSSMSVRTGLDGRASVTAVANSTAGGPYPVTAEVDSLSTPFQLTNLPVMYLVSAYPSDGNESISPPTQNVVAGDTTSFTVNASPGYDLNLGGVTGNCPQGSWSTTSTTTNTWTSDAIESACSVYFSATQIHYPVTVSLTGLLPPPPSGPAYTVTVENSINGNAGEQLVFSDNISQTFQTELVYGDTFSVTVTQSPVPVENCFITNGTGSGTAGTNPPDLTIKVTAVCTLALPYYESFGNSVTDLPWTSPGPSTTEPPSPNINSACLTASTTEGSTNALGRCTSLTGSTCNANYGCGGYTGSPPTLPDTSGPVPPSPPGPPGNGSLRLTDAAGSQAGGIVFTYPFPTTTNGVSPIPGIAIQFTAYSYGEVGSPLVNGADGFSFFLLDGSENGGLPSTLGPTGAGLGYGNGTNFPGDGIEFGYVGIGFDEFGNFAKGNVGQPPTPNMIAIRGPTSADNQLITSVDASLPYILYYNNSSADSTSRSQIVDVSTGRNVYRVEISSSNPPLATVYRNNSAVITAYSLPTGALPDAVYLGFAASTGDDWNIHEITDLIVDNYGYFHNILVTLSGFNGTGAVTVTNAMRTYNVDTLQLSANSSASVALPSALPTGFAYNVTVSTTSGQNCTATSSTGTLSGTMPNGDVQISINCS
ncbi:putative lipoprotein, rSAM/lipoprotein system [Legionella massiliensis]|uniref:Putative lipoprotein, rSAM/lipoprotein system n=1 Tax=Legionella massiliensis TaxID=1034943 RepID=A0A078KQI0_9GAMM|nr:Ig-like domain-containing protein [Legionella massiliensis]CDZ76660.1 putative lipoprotein, rSAM/lipoprotein system [Legionella massiliensis]CEE12398.1 Bacterial Ig-like domain (group 1) [Legionella massiliensis]